MIAYRDYHESVSTDECINRIENQIQTIPGSSDIYSDAINLLIETGELETGITDMLCKDQDRILTEATLCRNISICAGFIVCNLWSKNELYREKLYRIHTFLSALKSRKLPLYINVGLPEGFVYYGLYPETYLQATEQFYKEKQPETVIVIGLRSIGTQLSAVVSAELEILGCKVASCTVRPRGEPFDRKLQLDDTLCKLLNQSHDAYFIIVDEGPGLSGSSFGGTIQKLNELGIEKEKIVIFPSWNPEGHEFISASASEVWKQYRKYTGDFDQLWVNSGRLEGIFEKRIIRNLSAGMWRKMHYQNETDFPVVHPHHERRKFLLESNTNKKSIIKFIGLGKYGSHYLQRAHSLAEANFSPEIGKLCCGFIEMTYRKGTPVSGADAERYLFDFTSRYLKFINSNFKATLRVSYDKMMEMITYNIEKGIGPDYLSAIDKIRNQYKTIYEEDTVAVDGRILPHDFIKTEQGFIKVDHLEHHADQFFPGCQNIAWDIAGFCVEFGLTGKKRELFVDFSKNVDPFIEKKLSFFIIAYSAYRLGYVKLAADSLLWNSDGNKFREREIWIKEYLKDELCRI